MNNAGSMYKDVFYGIKNFSRNSQDLEGLKIETNFSKRLKDEFLSVRFEKHEFDQNYDINIMIWRKLFFTCHIIQINGHVDNQYFKVFFKVHMDGKHPRIELYKFDENEKCDLLHEKGHRFLEEARNNLDKRTRIYKDTHIMLKKFEKVIKKALEKKERNSNRKSENAPIELVRNVRNVSQKVLEVPVETIRNVGNLSQKVLDIPVEGVKNVKNFSERIVELPVQNRRNNRRIIFGNIGSEGVRNVKNITKEVIDIPVEGVRNVRNITRNVINVPAEAFGNRSKQNFLIARNERNNR